MSRAIPPDRFKRTRTLKGVPDPSRDLSILPPLQGISINLILGAKVAHPLHLRRAAASDVAKRLRNGATATH